MKMREKFKEEIINGGDFCTDILEKFVLSFYGKKCGNISCIHCEALLMLWLDEEYKEPELTFECDELVEVSNTGDKDDWYKRHYAYCKSGEHYVWYNGRSSKTAHDEDDATSFKYIRKYEQ